jgi:single-stranded-DNA-specific exonuclease
MKSHKIKLAGVTVGDAQENIKKFGCRDIGSFALVREPNNPHDPNAIRVELAGLYLGYLPRHIAKDLAPVMDVGRRFIALFANRNEHSFHDTVGLTVKIVEYPYQVAA